MNKKQVEIDPNFSLDVKSKIPYYYQLKKYLLEEIGSGKWVSGDMLPYENQLCKYFDVSRTVVRQTLQELQNDGYIVTRKGKGTFISEPEISEDITQNLFGFFEAWTSLGFKVENHVLEFEEKEASPGITSALNISSKDKVIFLKRLTKLNDKPYSINMNYLPCKNFKDLDKEDLRFTGLSTIINKKYNLSLPYVRSSIEIALARKEEAELLKIRKGDPLFLIEGTSFSNQKKPMVVFHVMHIGLRTKIRVELNKAKVYKRNENIPSNTTLVWDAK